MTLVASRADLAALLLLSLFFSLVSKRKPNLDGFFSLILLCNCDRQWLRLRLLRNLSAEGDFSGTFPSAVGQPL